MAIGAAAIAAVRWIALPRRVVESLDRTLAPPCETEAKEDGKGTQASARA